LHFILNYGTIKIMENTLAPLAVRIGCDVPTLLARIAASEHLCNVIADALTRAVVQPDGDKHLLSPAQPVSPLPCKLDADKSAVTARYPEILDAMKETVKALGWSWNGRAGLWSLTVNAFNGPALDRLVEAGAALLAAGVIVSVPSAEIARRIKEGDYQPVQERWVTKLVGGKHAGWFNIAWGRKDDLYRPAMKIHGARYVGGSVAAPPESYDEVLDFAQVYGYSISEGAQKLADEARQRAWQIAVVEPPTLRQRKNVRDRGQAKPARMAAPDAPVEVDSELLDTDD
jgi:hypothetical protein